MKTAAGILAVSLGLSACGGAEGPESSGQGTADMPSNAVPAAPGAMPPQGAAGQPAAPPSGMAGAPPNDMAQAGAGAEPMMPPGEVPPVVDEPADNCMDRRVSYAVPCHDDPDPCGIASGWPGDEYCLLPPAEGEGFQIHIGPDDYTNETEVAKYVIQAGEEFNNSVLGHIPLEQDVWFDRITVHMRPGSHHWISSVVSGKPEEGVYADTSCEGAMQVGSIGGGQNLIYDNPPGGVPAPENEGLGRPLAGNSSLCMNLHAYNYSEEPQLRELWINIYTVDEAAVTQRASGIGVVGGLGMSIAPGVKETLTYTEIFPEAGRIIQLFGHRHVWTPRFAVWLNDDLIYDSWDWRESVTFNYDSLTTNPAPDPDKKLDGAASGVIDVAAGDELTFSCFIENESDVTLRFRNELYEGEMCNLWGSAIGTGISAQRL
jgi:hypothetical protein